MKVSELFEGVMHVSVHGSDNAADAWYATRKKMVDAAISHLTKELKEKGNEYNTHGPLNVALILGEKFDEDDFEYSPRLHSLAVRVLRTLESKPHGWEKIAGYKVALKRLKEKISQIRESELLDLADDDLILLEKKWIKTDKNKRGMFSGRDISSLRDEYKRLKASGPHARGSKELEKMHELSFAIRMKKGHGKPGKM
jgi:hypothetical protein